MRALLKAKHWQLFSVFYGLPLLFESLLFFKYNNRFSNINSSEFLALNFLNILIPLLIYFIWLWYVGKKLNYNLPLGIKQNEITLNVSFLFIILYLIFLFFLINSGILYNFITLINNSKNINIIIPFLFITLLTFFALLFCCFFVAKSLRRKEIKRNVKFDEFFIDFLLIIVLFPIGIWFIQPRINKLFSSDCIDTY